MVINPDRSLKIISIEIIRNYLTSPNPSLARRGTFLPLARGGHEGLFLSNRKGYRTEN